MMPVVLVPLAQGCEELEAVTIIDLLRRAGLEVVTASLDEGPVVASRGVVLIADTIIDSILDREFDMIVLPGGLQGAQHLEDDPRIRKLLIRMQTQGRFIAAICAAPKVLAATGILRGKTATGYPGILERLELTDTQVLSKPVVSDGKVVTSRGPGTAMEFALTLIALLAGEMKRAEVENALVRS